MTYRERRMARAERLRTWSETRAAKTDGLFRSARAALDGIEPGQPILVGHHSERRHRAALDRHDRRMRAAFDNDAKSRSMASRAAAIEQQAADAIYSDDVDAIDRLRDKIAGLEVERARIKAVNAAIRKHGFAQAATQLPLTDAERDELLKLATLTPYHKPLEKGFPAYALQNLGGNITRLRKRLEHLSGGPAAAPTAPPTGDTATARAGLIVEAGMTTPTRAGKQPRPVWTVRGNLAEWRPLLVSLDGHWYRGAFSFWNDPSDAIEAACLDAEATDAARRADNQKGA